MIKEIRTEFVEANGLRFEVDMCGDGDKFAMCLHGFPEHAYSWREQLPTLAELGYTVWAPNLRGYGKSSRPKKAANYRMDLLVEDVAQLIDAAGAESTLLIGHDWGGMIAWDFALRRKRPLDRLIIMNIPHPMKFIQGLRSLRQLAKSWYVLFFQVPILPEFYLGMNEAKIVGSMFYQKAINKSRFTKDVLDFYRQQVLEPAASAAMINYYRANISIRGIREKLTAWGAYLETPTLMLWGEADHALGKELTYDTDKLVKNLTIVYLPDVSHWVQQEAPEAVNALIEAWLAGDELPKVGPGGKLLS